MKSKCNQTLMLIAVGATIAMPSAALAGLTPVMTFEEFADGATNVDTFYAGVNWVNEEVFNSAGTPRNHRSRARIRAGQTC